MPHFSEHNQNASDAAAEAETLPVALADTDSVSAGMRMIAPAARAASAAAKPSVPRRRLDAFRGLFFGPVFLRDLRVASRSRITYVTRSVIVGVLLAVLVIAYSAVFAGNSGLSTAAQFQRLQVIAPNLTLSMVWFYFIVFPILAASGIGGIASEHARGTLSAMASTPMSPASVVLSAFSARMVQIALLFGLTLPAIIIVGGYGGIDLPALFTATLVTLCTIILAGSFASLGAVVGKKPGSAAAFGIGLLVLASAYPLLLLAIAAAFKLTQNAWWQHARLGSPFMAMMSIPGLTGGGFGSLPPVYFAVIHCSISLTISICTLAISFAVWRGRVRRMMAGAPVLTRKAKLAARRLAALQVVKVVHPASSSFEPDDASKQPLNAIAASSSVSRAASRSRIVGDRPVLWHELQQLRPFASVPNTIGTVLPLVGLGALYYTRKPSTEGFLILVVAIATMLSVFVGGGSAANALSTEIHRRTLPLLLTTRQTVRQLLWEKFFAAWLRPWPLAFALMVHCLVGWLFGGPPVLVAIPLLFVLAGGTAMAASSVLLGAVLMRRAGGAIGFAIFLLSTIWVFPWVLLAIISLLLAINNATRLKGVPDFLMLLNPMAVNSLTAAGLTTSVMYGYQSVGIDMPTLGRISLPVWWLINAGFMLLAVVWTLTCMGIAHRSFNRSVLPRLV